MPWGREEGNALGNLGASACRFSRTLSLACMSGTMVGVPIILHRAGGGRQVFDPMWGIIYRATQADIPRRTPVELGLDLRVQVVVGVLRLPVAPGHPQRVLNGAVGFVAGRNAEFIHQGQPFPVLTAIGIETLGEGAADALLVVRSAELNKAFQVGVVFFDVRVGMDEWIIPHRPGRPCVGVKYDFGVPRILPQVVQVTLCYQSTDLWSGLLGSGKERANSKVWPAARVGPVPDGLRGISPHGPFPGS